MAQQIPKAVAGVTLACVAPFLASAWQASGQGSDRGRSDHRTAPQVARRQGQTLRASRVWNRLRYSIWAPWYDRLVAPGDFGRARRRSIQQLGLGPGAHVLLVGAGTGLDLEHLRGTLALTAVDVTPAMLRRLRRRARRLGLNVESRIMDAHRLAFPDGTFDAVVLHLILTVVADPWQVLRESERVLKSGGRLAVFDKFLRADEEASLARHLANLVIRPLFSDLNRRLEPLVSQTQLEIVSDVPAAFGGLFRIVTLEKPGA